MTRLLVVVGFVFMGAGCVAVWAAHGPVAAAIAFGVTAGLAFMGSVNVDWEEDE